MSDGQKLNILLVDDESLVREMVGSMLTILGYDCMAVKDGSEALDAFKTDRFDMVLTDINMPRMDGWELSLRLTDIDPDIPVIAMTGDDPNGILAKLQGSPITQALFKPFSMLALRDTLTKVRSETRRNAVCM